MLLVGMSMGSGLILIVTRKEIVRVTESLRREVIDSGMSDPSSYILI